MIAQRNQPDDSYLGGKVNSQLAPIVVFCYNRPNHLRRCISALKCNELASASDLVIISDGPRSSNDIDAVQEVRSVASSTTGFQQIRIIERERNYGLAASVIDGVSSVINSYGKVIVIEDDVIASPYFLKFMNDALSVHAANPSIFSVGGYCYPIRIPRKYTGDTYLTIRAESWGWGTWASRWNKVDWGMKDYQTFTHDKDGREAFSLGGADLVAMLDLQMQGKIDSWAIRWDYWHFKSSAYCLRPRYSLIDNIGFDGTGVHCQMGDDSRHRSRIWDRAPVVKSDVSINTDIQKEMRRFFSGGKFGPLKAKLRRLLRSIRYFLSHTRSV